MTKAELIEKLYAKHEGDLTKRLVGQIVDGVFENMSLTLKKEKRFAYPGFGTWTVRSRKKRKGRNPQTGEVITIKASKTVGFRPAKALKETL
jgi:DNA-binding protein HU-beta